MTDPFGFLLAFSGADAGDIRFALSEGADALRWRVLHDSAGVLRGGTEPFLVRGEDGRIVCLASGGDGVRVWSTADLETWNGPHPLIPGVRAPKAYRDAGRGDHQLICTAGGQTLTARTSDFVSASPPLPMGTGDDVALLHAAGTVHSFRSERGVLVHERDDAVVKHAIGDGEAAIVFAGLGGRTWYLLAATHDGLRPYVTRNLATGAWQPASPDGMPPGARRGGVVTVTEDEFKRLESHA